MNPVGRIFLVQVALFLLAWPGLALAQSEFPQGRPEFLLGVGYSNISIGSSSIENEGALHWDPVFSFSPLAEALPQLRLGAAVGVSLLLDNSSRTLISNNGQLIITGSSEVPLWLLEPEVRLSWRQTFGDRGQFFIEPGIAGGFCWGFLDIDVEGSPGESFDKSDSTLFGRAFLRLGAQVPGGTAGVEASYLSGGTLEFADNARGHLNEWYVGIFGALQF